MRATIVGEAPGRRGNRTPLDGPAGDRLARLAGMADRGELLQRFDAVNLLGRWPGSSGKGAAWPRERSRRAARRRPLRGVCVLLGLRVAGAYGLEALGFYEWLDTGRALAVAIPHPSGVNHLYNDPAHRLLAGQALRAADNAAILLGVPDRDPVGGTA